MYLFSHTASPLRHLLRSAIFILTFSWPGHFVQAAISLDHAIQSTESNPLIEHITGMVELADGSILAADGGLGALVSFNGDKALRVDISGDGKAFGSRRLGGISLAANQHLVISNSDESSFAILGEGHKLLLKQVDEGSAAGQVSEPQGIAWSANQRIYIADTDNNRISVFGGDGVFLQTIGQRLQKPTQVFVDAAEQVYVFTRHGQGEVFIFDADGGLVKQISHAALEKMLGQATTLSAMTIDRAGRIYLADSQNGRIFQLDWQRDKKLLAFGSKGRERGQFNNVSALLVLRDGRLAVADSGNKKLEIYKIPETPATSMEQLRLPTVLHYDPVPALCDRAYRLSNGKTLCFNDNKVLLLGLRGDVVKQFAGDFSRLMTAASDEQNIVIIDDNRIKIYNLDGEARFQGKGYAGEGSSDGKLDSPQGAYIKGDKLFIADTGNRRIQIFSRDGIYLEKISNPEKSETVYFKRPVAVAVDAQDNIVIADQDIDQVLVFGAGGKYLYRLGGQQENQKRPFSNVYDIAMDADNNLYLLCSTENSRYSIQVYRGPQQVIAFASYASGGAGIQQATNISVAKSRKTIIGVYDRGQKRLLNYSYLQVPARVSGMQVAGELNRVVLRWQAVPGSYIAGYNIYGSDAVDGEYRFLSKVISSEAVIQHNNNHASHFYKVAAASGLGTESVLSRAAEDVFRTAFQLFSDKQYAKAAALFTDSLQQNTQQPEMLKYLGLSQLELGRTDEAVDSFKSLSAISGYEAEGMNLLIRGLLGAQAYIEAKAVVDRVIEKAMASTETYISCGKITLKLDDAIGAVTCLEEALKRDDKNISAHFLMGEAYVKLGIVDKGLAEFDLAAQIDPNNANVWYRAGVVMQSLGKHQPAVEKFTRALQIDKKYVQASLGLAESYLQLNQLDKVKNLAVSLAGQEQTAAQGQYLLGLVALAADKNGEALLALTKSTRMDNKNAEAWLALAAVYEKLGQQGKLREILQNAVTADATSFVAAYRLGVYEYDQKNYADAVSALEKASALDSTHYDAHLRLAYALQQQNELKQAQYAAAVAAKLNTDSSEPLLLLSSIANKQGKTAAAIDYIKQAMQKQPNAFDLHVRLGELYVDNNLFDLALPVLEKSTLLDKTSALPHVLLGRLYSKRRLFDKSIAAYDRAVSLDPRSENKLLLDTAYAEKKKSLDFASNAPQIVLKDLRLNQVFSATYKQYANKPVGSIRVQNTSGTDYGNLKLTFAIKGYMDFPDTRDISKLAANETLEVNLLASFNNKILDIDEDTGVQAEVALHFVRDGREDAIRLTQPMTIYGKNAILWGQPDMVGSFVTPKDDTLRDFVRQAINENKPEPGPLNANLVSAMTLFDVLSAHGIRYVIDPNSPYSRVQADRVDYVQFSRETLKIKSGDCDDLSVLMSTGLENLGIETAIVDVPGHLFMMFNTGLSADKKDRISLQEDLLVIRNQQVWIPVEATMIGTSFAEAWTEGARKYQQAVQAGTLKVIPLQQAWETYLPVTLRPAGYSIGLPEKQKVGMLVTKEQHILLQKSLDRLVRPYLGMVEADPNNIDALMQVAIIYARYGLYAEAEKTFDKILAVQPDNSAVHNNRGNIYYVLGQFDRAIETYSYAEQLAANDAGVKMNLAMAYYQLGRLNEARNKFEEAATISTEAARQYAGLGKLLSR